MDFAFLYRSGRITFYKVTNAGESAFRFRYWQARQFYPATPEIVLVMGEAAQSRYSDGTVVGCEYHFFVPLLIEVKILATQLGPSLVVGLWRMNKFSRLRCIGRRSSLQPLFEMIGR